MVYVVVYVVVVVDALVPLGVIGRLYFVALYILLYYSGVSLFRLRRLRCVYYQAGHRL